MLESQSDVRLLRFWQFMRIVRQRKTIASLNCFSILMRYRIFDADVLLCNSDVSDAERQYLMQHDSNGIGGMAARSEARMAYPFISFNGIAASADALVRRGSKAKVVFLNVGRVYVGQHGLIGTQREQWYAHLKGRLIQIEKERGAC